MRSKRWPVIWLCVLEGCANGPSALGETENYGFLEGGQVWVRGPWEKITPANDVDEVIDQLCSAVMALPRATLRDYGQEYCGAIYTLEGALTYASAPSPLGEQDIAGPSK